MFDCVLAALGAPGSRFYWQDQQVDLSALASALRAAEQEGQPVCLLGTAFALLHTVDTLAAQKQQFRLPPGSRLMDTGGFKGRTREIPQDELYLRYREQFGIDDSHIINEYGMTELSSQYYDRVLRDAFDRRQAAGGGRQAAEPVGSRQSAVGGLTPDAQRLSARTPDRLNAPSLPAACRLKRGPPWLRPLSVDPETLDPLPPGVPGLVRHVDLANLFSVVAVQTDDMGVLRQDGLELLGRAAGAEPRGCSLAMETLLGGR
jgi:hypothetical protein